MSEFMLNDETYIPYPESFVPEKSLKVRLIFIHFSEDDPRNFDVNNAEHVQFYDKIFQRQYITLTALQNS